CLSLLATPHLQTKNGGYQMDCEAEINDLKRRVEELETCCAEFRSCKGPMTERIEAVEKRL
ncbi:MAG: hypothetical protein ACXV48_08530, partial [Halobacteriota archaeon]